MRFLTPLDLRAERDGTWTLIAPFDIDLGSYGLIRVPPGFNTDLASVPRIFWSIIPPFGSHEEAAVLHDWLYRNFGHVRLAPGLSATTPKTATFSRARCDRFLLEGMIELQVPALRRLAIYRAVRLFGHFHFRKSPPGPGL